FALRHNKHRDGPELPFGTLTLEGVSDDPWVRLVLTEPTGSVSKELLARELLTALGKAQPEGHLLTRADIEKGLNDPAKPKLERCSRKIYGLVLEAMNSEGLFRTAKKGRADAWVWTFTDEE